MTRICSVRTLALAALLGYAAVAGAQHQSSQQDSSQHGVPAQQQYEAVQLEQVMSNPAQFMGKALSIEGQVDTVFGPHSFLLESDIPGSNPTIVVISPVPHAQVLGPIERSKNVRIYGKLHQLTPADFQQDYKNLISPDLQAELTSRPIFLLSADPQAAALPCCPGHHDPEALTGSARQPALEPSDITPRVIAHLDLSELMAEPQNYYGKHVAVLGEVQRILSNHAFVLEDETTLHRYEMLVVSLRPYSETIPVLAKDQEVRVPGVLNKLTVGMFPWSRDQFGVDEDEWDDFREMPVLVIGADAQPATTIEHEH